MNSEDYKKINTDLGEQLLAAKQRLEQAATTGAKRRAERQIRKLKDTLYHSNEKLVYEFTRRWSTNKNQDLLEDLNQCARLGLYLSLDTWDPNKGALSSWARCYMNTEARDIMAQIAGTTMAGHDFQRAKRVKEAISDHREEFGSTAELNIEWLADQSGLKPSEIRRVIAGLNRKIRSLDAHVTNDENSTTLGELEADKGASTASIAGFDNIHEHLEQLLKETNPTAVFEYLLHYDQGPVPGLPHPAIGFWSNVSKEAVRRRVSQTETVAEEILINEVTAP